MIDGAELIPEKGRKISFVMTTSQKEVLQLMGVVANLELDEIGRMHQAFRKPAASSSPQTSH